MASMRATVASSSAANRAMAIKNECMSERYDGAALARHVFMATQRTSGKIVRAIDKQRKIQSAVDRKDARKSPEKKSKNGIQTGSRTYPSNPLPAQHHQKPGLESDIRPRPMFDNPLYRGSGKLEGMVALITGGDSGIGRSVAVL